LNTEDLHHSYAATIDLPTSEGRTAHSEFQLLPKSVVTFDVGGNAITLKLNGKRSSTGYTFVDKSNFDQWLEPLAYATPRIRQDLKSLRGPDYPLLTHSIVKASNSNSTTLYDVLDSVGDDSGSGRYVYPHNTFFKPGVLDLTRFVVKYDHDNAYFTLKFRSLSNPGWHPEYGFQLTYAAIAIDQDSIRGSGTQLVSHNANYLLPEKNGYEKLILVGGGIQLEDGHGKVLAAYVPSGQDTKNPLGSTLSGTIAFALPLSYLGKPDSSWTFTVLSGAQDDHGGAGLGEFRTVNKSATEWNGGGKQSPDDSNVYDVLIAAHK
jgi:C-terminal binding-module, SLH-like, of glucodextranase